MSNEMRFLAYRAKLVHLEEEFRERIVGLQRMYAQSVPGIRPAPATFRREAKRIRTFMDGSIERARGLAVTEQEKVKALDVKLNKKRRSN